jgi:hypothetical protein
MPKLNKDEFGKLVSRLLRDAREYDRTHDYSYKTADASGVLISIVSELYNRLKDDDFLASFYPEYLQERIDEIGQEVVMEKLES